MDLTIPWQEFLQQTMRFIPRLIAALVIFGAGIFLSGWAARWAERAAKNRTSDPELLRLLSRLTRWAVLIVGLLLALEQVNFDLTAFVAGLGIIGFTVGFALQDIARNFVAGILLLIGQPFNIGDSVRIGEWSGTVLDVKLRATEIKTWDGEKVILPNMDVFTSALTNYSELPERRRTVKIGLGYEEDVPAASGVFLEAMQGVEGVLQEPAPSVLAEELGDSALILAARFWVNKDTDNLVDVHSRVVTAITQAATRAGINLPYPTQSIRIEGSLPREGGE